MKTATELFKEARDFLISHRTDYEIAYKNYRQPPLEKFNWALDWFDVLAKNNSQTALWIVRNHHGQWLDQKISYQEMSSRSNKVARYFQKLGMKRGDSILIMLPNVLPLWETILAVMKLGGIVVPTSTQATEADLQDRVQRGNIKFLLTDVEGSEKVEKSNITSPLTLILTGAEQSGWKNYEASFSETEDFVVKGFSKATDPFLLYFTSGTTAKPKLVLHTHQSYPVGHLSTMYWIGIKEGDVHQNISSPGWAKHAWSSFFAPWNAGATILVHDYARFNAKESLEVLSRCQVNTLCAPPTVWRMLILENLGPKPPHLRELAGAGEPLNPEIIEVVQSAWNLQIRDGFGQTETTAQIGNSPGQKVKLGSMGRPLPGYVPVLLNEKEEEALEGEIALKLTPERPLGLMQGYQDDPERTAKVMAHGYYRTGDEAAKDEEGYFHYVGRGDDVFKSSDYRISPFELESVLLEHDSVAEAAIIPSPDDLRLYVPKAIVVLKPGLTPGAELAQEILDFCKEKLAPYKRIRRLEFADLPKTISGKIRRVQLRAIENERIKNNQRGPQEYWLSER
ncbi:MAG: AMP-binding protein [Bdellovibrio sp.]